MQSNRVVSFRIRPLFVSLRVVNLILKSYCSRPQNSPTFADVNNSSLTSRRFARPPQKAEGEIGAIVIGWTKPGKPGGERDRGVRSKGTRI